MAAGEQARSGGGKLLLLLAVILMVLWVCNTATLVESSLTIPGVGEVQTQPHAVARHGTEAEAVREHLSTGDPPHRWRCRGGKEYLYKPAGDGMVDLMVVTGGNLERTAFRASENYLEQVLQQDGCEECNGFHDSCNGPIPLLSFAP